MNDINLLTEENSVVLSKTFSIFGSLLLNIPSIQLIKEFQKNNLFLHWYIEPVKHVNIINELTQQSTAELTNKNILNLLKQDYTDLFIFGDLEIKAMPWASVYLNKNNETFAEETYLIKNIYNQYNFQILDSFKEPEDHIGLQLTFLGFLLKQWKHLNIKEKDNCQKTINNFLANYILPWFPSFFNKIRSKSTTVFYKLIAYLLDDFLLQVKTLLNIEANTKPIYY